MFSIITKRDYWSYLDSGAARTSTARLKDIQDAFMLYELREAEGKRILELGGGNSRILPLLAKKNECWNVDKFEGRGHGPSKVPCTKRIKIVQDYMGNFSDKIPDEAFDYVISVSAVEHIASDELPGAIKDCYRVMKIGGLMFHAIDVYLLDRDVDHPRAATTSKRIELYRSIPDMVQGGFEWLSPPDIDENVRASASFAANSCDELYTWNQFAPKLNELREIALSCSIRLGVRKVN